MHNLGKDIAHAASLLKEGELVVIPTETVYGLAANAFDPSAVDKIYILKNRPRTNPLILHISGIDQADRYASDIPEVARLLMEHFWPGPLTVLLPKTKLVPDYITAGSKNVALRVPRKKITLNLLKSLDFPLVAPSANPFTYISPTRPEHLFYCYGAETPYVLDGGPCEEGIESTIVGFEEDKIIVYRPGAITFEALEKVTEKTVVLFNKKTDTEVTPGMHYKHYSPKTTVILESINNIESLKLDNAGWITFTKELNKPNAFYLGKNGISSAASQLYDTLYKMDAMELSTIVIEKLPETELGRSIMDRLKRSTSK